MFLSTVHKNNDSSIEQCASYYNTLQHYNNSIFVSENKQKIHNNLAKIEDLYKKIYVKIYPDITANMTLDYFLLSSLFLFLFTCTNSYREGERECSIPVRFKSHFTWIEKRLRYNKGKFVSLEKEKKRNKYFKWHLSFLKVNALLKFDNQNICV